MQGGGEKQIFFLPRACLVALSSRFNFCFKEFSFKVTRACRNEKVPSQRKTQCHRININVILNFHTQAGGGWVGGWRGGFHAGRYSLHKKLLTYAKAYDKLSVRSDSMILIFN